MNAFPLAAACSVLALALAGCVSESAELGAVPPVALEVPQLPVDLAARGAADRTAVRRALVEIGDGDVASVRIAILARSPANGDNLRRMLVGLGADPARLTVRPWHGPRDRLVFTRAVAETVPCAASIAPVAPDDPLPSLMSLGRCTQANNLADMLVDPGDLVAPPDLAAQDGDYAVRAVRAWRSNRDAPLPTQDTTGQTGAVGGGTTAGPSTAATAPAAGAVPATTAGTAAAAGTVAAVPAPAQ